MASKTTLNVFDNGTPSSGYRYRERDPFSVMGPLLSGVVSKEEERENRRTPRKLPKATSADKGNVAKGMVTAAAADALRLADPATRAGLLQRGSEGFANMLRNVDVPDIRNLPGAVRSLAVDARDYVMGDPANAAADLTVVGAGRDFLGDFNRAAELRAQGREGEASELERFAIPLLMAGIVPVGGKAARAGKKAAKGAAAVGIGGGPLQVIAGEYGPDIAARLDGIIPDDAPLSEWRAAAANIAGPEGAASNAPAAPAIIKNVSNTPAAIAQDVLREAKKPSKGSPSFAVWRARNPENGTLFDMSKLSQVPNVPQFQIPRNAPKQGPSLRIVEALANPEVEQGINETVQRGIEGGGKEWYNTEPVLDRMRGILPLADVNPAYAQLMDLMAATSPRARVPDNVRTGSYYNYLLRQGMSVPEKPDAGYGSIAQKLHRQNVEGLMGRGGWDVFKNPKPASFSSNLQGNQQVATIDTHNFRLPGILSSDPRFLETSIAELAKTPEGALETLLRQYPGIPEDVAQAAISIKPKKVSINYKPQDWVEKGYIPMEDAVNDPALWASKPRDNEYGYYEQWQQDQAKKMGVSPAQYQASMWLGGGDTTGLGSAAEPFIGTLEARIRYTADRLGLDPERVLDMMLKGEVPLLAKGGAVDVQELAEKYGA